MTVDRGQRDEVEDPMGVAAPEARIGSQDLLRQREGNVAAVNGRLRGRLSRHAVCARRIPAGSAENDILATVALVHGRHAFYPGRSLVFPERLTRGAIKRANLAIV
jgi:hypothetical protein